MPAIQIEGPGPLPGDDDLEFTPRGFAVYLELEDTYGNKIRIQESSSAEGPHIWLFCESMSDQQKGASPHLNLMQAEAVRDALDRAIARGRELWEEE
jgi:hypothetical protein